MSQAAEKPETSQAWSEALELAGRNEGAQVLVERLLELLRISAEAAGVALFVAEDSALTRRIVVGSGDFPDRIPPEASPEDGSAPHARLDLAGAAVLIDGGATLEVGDSVRVALAAAVRSLQLEHNLKQQRFEVNYRGVELEALYDVGLAIASTLNLHELSDEVLLRAVSLLDARLGALYLGREGVYELDRTFGGEARERLAEDDPQIQKLLESGCSQEQDLIPGAEHVLAVPIEADGQALGLLLVADKESRYGVGPFGRSDRRSLSMLANQASIALQNAHLHQQALEKERLEREAELAAQIQRRLLPAELPEFDGFELIGWNRPAREVGGDYYDLSLLGEDALLAVVADVTGKGMPAALMVSTLHSALRLLLDRESLGPDLVARLNRHVFDSSAPNKFITLLVATLDPRTGELSYLNAGHNPGMLVRKSGEVEELPTSGMPLGLFQEGSFECRTLSMEPGDLLCFYSDGITECESPADEEFGEDRLREFLRERVASPLTEIVADADRAVTEFAAGLPQGDDQTVVLLRRTAIPT